jgi:hydroxyacylglutathione hydrolase
MQNIIPLPAFSDNYIWLLRRQDAAAAVDPGDAAPVLQYCREHGLSLCAILITHHHADHTGGIAELVRHFACPVYGPANSGIAGISHPLHPGDLLQLTQPGLRLEVMATPGHTADHISYYGDGLLFCGDTLFACGCGRVFDGSTQQLHASLQRLAHLPQETQIYCTHEYTLANQRFALAVEPDNTALLQRQQQDSARRQRGNPTLPSTLATELATNPFLRCHLPHVRAAVEAHCGQPLADETAVFAAMREWKNTFS